MLDKYFKRRETYYNESGKRVLGALYETDSGVKIHMLRKTLRAIKINGKKYSLSEGIRNQKAGWSIPKSEIIKCKAKDVELICLYVKQTNEFYFIKSQDAMEPGYGFDQINKQDNRCVYVHHFWKVRGHGN